VEFGVQVVEVGVGGAGVGDLGLGLKLRDSVVSEDTAVGG